MNIGGPGAQSGAFIARRRQLHRGHHHRPEQNREPRHRRHVRIECGGQYRSGGGRRGAGGTTVANTPTVTFGNAVTAVGMPQANLTAQFLGLGGATADATNRLSANTPKLLLNTAGASINVTVNKNAAANDASFSIKSGFSVRALFGRLGSDDFTLKVSPNGSSSFDALVADRNTGRVRLQMGVALTGLAADPGSLADDWLWHNSTTGQLRARLGCVTPILADQDVPWITPTAGDYALTNTGAGSAAAGLAGAADRMDLSPSSGAMTSPSTGSL